MQARLLSRPAITITTYCSDVGMLDFDTDAGKLYHKIDMSSTGGNLAIVQQLFRRHYVFGAVSRRDAELNRG